MTKTLIVSVVVAVVVAVVTAVIRRDVDVHRVGVEAVRGRTRKADGANPCSGYHGDE